MPHLKTARGRSLPLGATALADGVNFALLCRHGTSVGLVLLAVDGDEALAEILLDPLKNRTGDHWHVLVSGLPPVFRYGWRVDGPHGPGHCFDPSVVLIDPACTALSGGGVWGQPHERAPHTTARRSVFVRRPYHWQEDAPPVVPLAGSVIYDVHVRGF